MKTFNSRILLLHGHFSNLGGVVNFYMDMEPEYENDDLIKKRFRIGNIQSNFLYKFTIIKILDFISRYALFIVTIIYFKPNILHINPSIGNKSIIRDCLFIKFAKVFSKKTKILTHFRGWDSKFISNLNKKIYINLCFKSMLEKSDGIIVLAESFKEELSQFYPSKKIEVVYTNVRSEFFINPERKNNKKMTFLFLSRIEKDKGIYELANAIKLLSKSPYSSKVKFIIAGDGSERKKFIKYCKNLKIISMIDFPGYIKNRKKIDTFRKSDAFIFPSYHNEGCPNSVLEALASGLPVISTPNGALKEILKNNENGIIVPYKSHKKLYDALLYFVENKQNLEVFSEKNRLLSKQFHTHNIFNKIKSVYGKLLC